MDKHPYPNILTLSQALARPIAVYDLEATTFRGRENFGITEVAMTVVQPTGRPSSFKSLINPERAIDSRVQALTGITPAMVRSQETWDKRFAGLFQRIAAGQAWLCGFNNHTFDNHAVKDIGARYGAPIEAFAYTFDVRLLYRKLTGAKTQQGTLSEIAALYGVQPEGELHRAAADVHLTACLLDEMVAVHGLAAVQAQLLPPSPGGVKRLSTAAVAEFLLRKSVDASVAGVAKYFQVPEPDARHEVGKALDERLVPPARLALPHVQAWLAENRHTIESSLRAGAGRLRSAFEAVVALPEAPAELDSVQLRVSLLHQGLQWTSLKP